MYITIEGIESIFITLYDNGFYILVSWESQADYLVDGHSNQW